MTKFISNPYVAGSLLREDVFTVQFTVYVELEIGILDNDRVSTYTYTAPHYVGAASTVSKAIDLANHFIKTYSDDIVEEHCEWSTVLYFNIFDREDRLVMGGKPSYNAPVTWAKPSHCDSERIEVQAKIDAMLSEASLEAGWDNYSTASSLRKKAFQLSWKLAPSRIVRSQYFLKEIRDHNMFN